jgi:hypothetical protein
MTSVLFCQEAKALDAPRETVQELIRLHEEQFSRSSVVTWIVPASMI